MSLLERAKKYVAKNNFASDHPLLKLGVERDVRDAYFDGLIFAALSDDEKIEEPERDYLAKVAQSLDIPEDEIDERLQNFIKSDPLNCGMEAVKSLPGKNGEVAKLFLCEFSRVWSSHHQSDDDLCEWRKQLSAWMHLFYDEVFFAKFDAVTAKVLTDPTAVYSLCDDFDDDVIRYLFSDIADVENIFSKKREEEERAVLPHPLRNSLSVEQKERYINAVRNAVDETSDNSPTKVQQKGLHHLAISLGVNGNDARAESISKVTESSFESEKRNIAFFLYCDIARLFAMDGHAEFSAIQYQKLCEVVTALKLSPEDTEFLCGYRVFIGNGNAAGAAEFIRQTQSSIRFPDGFIKYFTPNMKVIVLGGGDTPEGVYQIVDGHYRLQKTLKVGSNTRLVIKNAVIDFAPGAQIELYGKAEDISDSEFNGEKTEDDDLLGKQFFSESGNGDVKFERCSFNGAGCRSVIYTEEGNIVIESCRFNRLCGKEDLPIIYSDFYRPFLSSITISNSQFNDCRASGCFCRADSYGSRVEVVACDFISCTAATILRTRYDKDVVCKACLFERCDFKDFHKYDEVAESGRSVMSDNYFDEKPTGNVSGLLSIFLQSNCTMEHLREVRAELNKTHSN